MNRKRNTVSKDELLSTLRTLLGKDDAEFEPFQEQTVSSILKGQDVLAVVSTGSGKSLCYQVPAMHLPGVTLVITPLLALMKDQVKKLQKLGQPVACLSSSFIADRDGVYDIKKQAYTDDDGEEDGSLPLSVRKKRDMIFYEAAKADFYEKDENGKAPYKLIYITPERLRTGAFIRFARTADISMIAVDEAHCISMWGYEFRRRYLEIARLLRRMGKHPVIAAFTATATKTVRDDIEKFLGMKNCVYVGGRIGERENLNFSIYNLMDVKSKSTQILKKNRFLIKYLKEHEGESGFIYCSTSHDVNSLYERLKAENLPVTRYYARLDQYLGAEAGDGWESMEKNLRDFEENRKRIMISTNALGMGIDKKDIRFVIHYNLPLSLENYYQEAGRGGRERNDPQRSDCILLCSRADVGICRLLIKSSLDSSGLSDRDRVIRRNVANRRLRKMREYAGLKGQDSSALQGFILDYFNADDPFGQGGKRAVTDIELDFDKIDVLFSNRTKVAQELRKGNMSGTLTVGRRSSGKGTAAQEAVTVKYKVTGAVLDYFDMMVADAICTLIRERVTTIFPRTVMGLLAGDPELTLRPDRKEAVENSIRKMMKAYITIDRSRSKDCGFEYPHQESKSVLQGHFLPLYEKKNGFGYDPNELPPLYEYAEILNGQFHTLPFPVLNIGKCACGNKQADYHVSEDEFMERRIRIYRFIPLERASTTAAKAAASISSPAKYIPPTPENAGRPENPLLPRQLQTSAENLELLHYILHRIDTMYGRNEKWRAANAKQGYPARTRNIIRFDTMINTLRIDLKDKGSRDAQTEETSRERYSIRRKADSLWKRTVMILEHLKSAGVIKKYELLIKYP